MSLMRLQKFLSTAGSIFVPSSTTTWPLTATRPSLIYPSPFRREQMPAVDQVAVDGNPVSFSQPLIYIALNKPVDYVTSCSHPGEKIVLDLVDVSQRVYPIGRLDKDSTGLLLLTNDGRLHHKLSHPSFDHEKEYDVTVTKPISEGALRKLAAGLPLMDTRTRPARVRRIAARRFRIVLQEGKNRQVRRMVRKVGNQVSGLRRVRVANIKLGNLAQGAWRHLSEQEKQELLKIL